MGRERHNNNVTVWLLLTAVFCFMFIFIGNIWNDLYRRKHRVIVDWNSPEFIGKRASYYRALFAEYLPEEELPPEVVEEFEEFEYNGIRTGAQLIAEYGISFKEGTLQRLAIDCNAMLFETCSKYYLASYGGRPVSPILPMAIANTETPNLINANVAYSSLLPAGGLTISTADAVTNMSCVAVLENPGVFNALASDYSTEYRGPLQIEQNYGVNLESFNSLMGPPESAILSVVSSGDKKYAEYMAYEVLQSKSLSVGDWLSGISSFPGDRYSVRDNVLRFASYSQQEINAYQSMYEIGSDMEVVALIAMAHDTRNLWEPENRSRRIGEWRSGTTAYTFLKSVSSEEFINKITEFVSERLTDARDNGKRVPLTLDRREALSLLRKAEEEGIVFADESYLSSRKSSLNTYCYPVQAMYNYLMLTALFSGM